MVQLEAKRARFLSIQLLSKTYINVKTVEGRQLQSRVHELECRWEAVTARASDTQHRLQGALLQCQEFHHTVQDYLLWLEGMESRMRHCEPIRLSSETSLLWDKYNMLRVRHSCVCVCVCVCAFSVIKLVFFYVCVCVCVCVCVLLHMHVCLCVGREEKDVE